MPKVNIDEERCKGCTLCVDACPRDVLAMSERLNSAGYPVAEAVAESRCTACLYCVRVCPDVCFEILTDKK